jgi:hypothetical protein
MPLCKGVKEEGCKGLDSLRLRSYTKKPIHLSTHKTI